MSIATLARAVLAADAGVIALVKTGAVTRIYPAGEAPQPMVLPTITYSNISKVSSYSQDGVTLVKARVEFSAWAATYASATAVARAIRDAIHSYPGDPAGVQDFEAANERDLTEDVQETGGTRRLQRISMDFFAYARDAAA